MYSYEWKLNAMVQLSALLTFNTEKHSSSADDI